ncbi:alpha/beta fold hydrolase [Litoreibacter roseus]|uniref:AB hydrolase-1 domain-containing protein n=1 Tax=Litoreibacter roseus TaxID=2601869 RepID=A0A6N6JND9_9RHOB|nr:alpha/beta hydrolase [Litoreibacter roseus]GFE67069.1 hypothetical protein KIN_41430 [Litoreibacter roseus]
MLVIDTPEPHSRGVATSSDGVDIPYQIFGDGPETVLFVHGWCCDHSIWGDQIAALCSDYTVVALDLASHGSAGKRQNAWPMSSYVQDALAVVKAVNRPSWALVGHSLGGVLVAMLAAEMRAETAAVVVVDAIKRPDQTLPQQDADAMLDYLSVDWPRNVPAWLAEAAFTNKTSSEIVSYVERALGSADGTTAVEGLRDFLAQDHAKLLDAIRDIPVLLMNGAPPAPSADFFDAFHPDCKLVEFEGAGHFVMLERVEDFNRCLREELPKMFSAHLNESSPASREVLI